MKNEFKVIADLVEKNTRVLDVGCADGVLMEFLRDNKNIDIRGLEISKNKVQKCKTNPSKWRNCYNLYWVQDLKSNILILLLLDE